MSKGTFEVHLITTPENQNKLFAYITNLKNDKLIKIRPTCANSFYGDCHVQPMLTFWIHDNDDTVMKLVTEIKKDMELKGITIIRIKIESMAHNIGVPQTCSADHYFEYHFKVDIQNTEEWNNLVKLCLPFGCHLFYNPYNKTMTPVCTIRNYFSFEDIAESFNQLNKVLEDNKFAIHSIEREYSVYDSNVLLDHNWLFCNNNPREFITKLETKMLCA